MAQAILNCSFSSISTYQAVGDEVGFGHGLNSVTINPTTNTATILRLTVDGDASLIRKIEYDCTVGGPGLWMWLDGDNDDHQVLTGIRESHDDDVYHVIITVENPMDETINGLFTYITTYNNDQRIISNLRIYNEDNQILNMATHVERFSLPYDNWYDEEGRIYKDILIKNLDACEQKLFEVQGLDAFDVEPPDIETMIYPDTTLESDDNCIVNLKSFLTIMNLINYPIELTISGTKIRKLSYWNSNYQYITKQNVIVESVSEENKFVYLDASDNEIKATNNPSTATSGIFIGVYENGIIRGIHEGLLANLNLMYMLSAMQKDLGSKSGGTHNGITFYNNGRMVGFGDGESRSGEHGISFADYGREV